MDVKQIAKATSRMLMSYLTYESVRLVLAQLQETDPPRALWFQQFSTREKIQDGDRYLTELLVAHQELALRVMTVREHLAEEVLDYMPEMTRAAIQQANLGLRCSHLEKIVNAPPPVEQTQDPD